MHIKAYIKAEKFDIQIPQALNFVEPFEEEMEEMREKIADEKERIATMKMQAQEKKVKKLKISARMPSQNNQTT